MEYRIKTEPRSGSEHFLGLDQTLLDYWRWAHADIASNAERGKLAEFIVKCAVASSSPCRIEWDAVDVIAPDGTKIEVKSPAYLQTWKCTKLSKIQFDIAPKKSWDSETNQYYAEIGRNSDVYVFCLFACKDPAVANPLDMTQWEFYILDTKTLNDFVPTQKTISLGSLIRLGAKSVPYPEIAPAIKSLLSNH